MLVHLSMEHLEGRFAADKLRRAAAKLGGGEIIEHGVAGASM